MSGVTTATVIAGITAAAAVAGTVYSVASSSSRQQSAAPAPMPANVELPKVPEPVAPAAPEPVPTKDATAPKVSAAADPARGVQGTMLTGGLGVSGEAPTKKKTLLGG